MLVESDCLLLKEKICMDSETKKAALKRLSFASFGAKAGLEPARISTVVRLSYKLL